MERGGAAAVAAGVVVLFARIGTSGFLRRIEAMLGEGGLLFVCPSSACQSCGFFAVTFERLVPRSERAAGVHM